jgi:hypothetical protein
MTARERPLATRARRPPFRRSKALLRDLTRNPDAVVLGQKDQAVARDRAPVETG